MTVRQEYVDVANAVLALPDEVQAVLADRFATSEFGIFSRLARVLDNLTFFQVNGDLGVTLFAIEVAHAVRLSLLDGELVQARASLPQDGEVWTTLRAAMSDEVAEADLAELNALIQEDA